MNAPVPLYALIVGIDQWANPRLPSLQGCVHDAELMRRALQERFAVPAANIVSLVNSQATRAGITAAFRTQLIDRARQWATTGSGPSPAFVFFYAGHGSRARDNSGTQSDGLDETMVPHDSRTENIFDIKDWELGGWLDELTNSTQNVTVILDCCHAGSGTRDVDSVGTARTCPPDLRVQPEQRPVAVATGTRGATTDRYTLLAACRSTESAQEYTVQEATGTRKQGAFTWFLAQELMRLPEGRPSTYRELFERVRHQVHSHYQSQMPQCEGDRDRELFGGVTIACDPLLTVEQVEGDRVWIDAGQVHGLSAGAKLELYPPGTRALNRPRTPPGTTSAPASPPTTDTLIVVECEAVRSLCRSEAGRPVELLSRAVVSDAGLGLAPRQVAIDVEDAALQEEIMQRLAQPDLRPYLKWVADSTAAEFRVTEVQAAPSEGPGSANLPPERLGIRDATGRLLVEPVPRAEIEHLVQDLAGLCRYRHVLELRNRSRRSELAGQITVEFHEVVTSSTGSDTGPRQRSVRDVRPIPRTADGLPLVTMGTPIAISVKNASDQPVYCEAISLGYDYAIVPLTGLLSATGTQKRIAPGGMQWFGRDQADRRIMFSLPSDPQALARFTAAHEHLKVMVSIDSTDYEILRQSGLRLPTDQHRSVTNSALGGLLQQIMSGGRALGVEAEEKVEHDWTTVEQEYLVTRQP